MRRMVETYKLPNIDCRNLAEREENETDLLRGFSEACRDLHLYIVSVKFPRGQTLGRNSLCP
jgi:hypothetical protein